MLETYSAKISVIVPCYNVEKFLAECLESVFAQTLKEIEVICIDDGSIDGTLGLLETFSQRHENLCIIKQENSGSGKARNEGIVKARGEYVAFMDADDFYPESDVLECVYHAATEQNAKICGGASCNYRDGIYNYTGLRKGFVFSEDMWIGKEEFPAYSGYWRFIYKREFLVENNIFFPDYRRCQDPPFFLKAIAKAERVYCLKKLTYCYRKEHKRVVFDEAKAVDYAKGMRDSLKIAFENDLSVIYCDMCEELHGELSALMYKYAADGSLEMQRVIRQINEMIAANEEKIRAEIPFFYEGEEVVKYINGIKKEKKELFDSFKSYPHVLIFGAGTVGRQVMEYFRQQELYPEAFVVSDLKQNNKVVDGVAVRCIDEYIAERENCIIIIATFKYLQNEISNILREKGFTEVYPIDMEKFCLFQETIMH